jgi:tetratricopeptide (TPR) repeat protein
MYQQALQGYEKAWGPDHTSTLDTVNNLAALYADQGKLVEAEQMYQRALQGYEKAIDPDNIITYVPALNTIWGFGSLLEQQANVAQARTMYAKALCGYKQIFGPEHARSKTLRNKLCALDARVKNEALIEIEERADDLPIGSSHPGLKKPPSTSKRHKLFRKLTLRFRP